MKIEKMLGVNTFSEKCKLLSVLDNNFKKDMKNIFKEKIENSKQLQNIFLNIQNKYKILFEKYISAEKLEEKIYFLELSLGYFSLLEALNENSYILKDIVVKLKNKYGKHYIEKIAEVDRDCLSKDAKVFLNKDIEAKNYDEDLLNMYVVMKNWQDIQHEFSVENYDHIIYDIEDEYIEKINKKYNLNFEKCNRRMYENKALKLIIIVQKYLSKSIVPISKLAALLNLNMDEYIIKIYGGKAYGLAKLKKVNASILETYCVTYLNYINIEKEIIKKFKNQKLAIRSSANVEDGEKNSFAGMFDTYLNISINDVDKYVAKVISSKENSRVKEYAKKSNITNINVSVVLQSFTEPSYSAIFLGQSLNTGVLEYAKGNGEKIVSGHITPQTIFIKENENFAIESVDISKYIIKLQKKLGKISDFEFCIIDKKIIMLQYRPVTKILEIKECIQKDISEKNEFYGIAASSGIYEGNATYVRKLDEKSDFVDGDILMCWFTSPDWIDLISRSKAIVTAVGGILCHTAIISRELGIPCVTGIGPENMKKIWNDKHICVDGTIGKVTKKDKK
ncbi:MAG: PEP/pyruvate-binding domain-containing protein [Cetobacterium sp.]